MATLDIIHRSLHQPTLWHRPPQLIFSSPSRSAPPAAVKETSFYPALANLLNATGELLKPRVLAVSQLKNTGAGSPNFGLFAAHQISKGEDETAPQQPWQTKHRTCSGHQALKK